ncbi:MAG TPA: DUF3048 domain-containing protein [Candidatus Saccharimonadales bacterium]|nr:DUF3048 domain-containing protein [Candidatus Saccharimonadales bacterium]
MFRRRLYAGQSFGHSHRVRSWIRHHKKIAIPGAVIFVLLLGVGGFAVFKLTHKKAPPAAPVAKKETPKPAAAPAPLVYHSPLTGLEVTKDQSERPVTGIMIENSPDARPQSGMIDAGVVFEAIAEGGITRFLTLFQEKGPTLVGPVRSVRSYYVDWLGAFDAGIAHVGGSAAALQTVRGGGFKDLDQFFNGGYYWRATDRYAPHNVYTSFEKLNALNQAKGYTHSNFTGFPRKAEAASATPNATKIQINISSGLYDSTYAYDKSSNTYLRSEGGAPHIDRESKQQLHPKVVIAMKVQESTVLEDGYRENINAIGNGDCWVFQDGNVQHGTWQKAGIHDQIIFKDDNNSSLKLNPGQTWIAAVPNAQSVTWQP